MNHQVVVGLGCPFLGDDSVGIQVIRHLRHLAGSCSANIRLVESHAGGLLLLEELTGARQAIIIDAVLDDRRVPGEVVVANMDMSSCHAACGHDCDLPQAMAIGRAMGMPLPDNDHIHLVGVVAENVSTFTEHLSTLVAAALPLACQTVWELINEVTFEEDAA